MSLEAFKSRVLPVKDKLYRFALRFLRDEDEARDVVQEVLIKVWNKREEMDQLENMEAWCMRITRNVSLDRLKSKHNKYTTPIEEGFDVSGGDRETPYRSTELSDTMKTIGSFIQALPEKQRQVIQLRDVEGYSYQEISEIMEIDMNQVKVNLFRARKAVKENLLNINAYGLG
ncbi:RNA polymerase ECF-type sigma factor [Fulvivirga imtechensis AK7]|uniref:RNA polymerase ECF-type sigma factor n=1 Tax=Fulvivirga imtechensis AK7 TaxID=1237149 RepID=L8K278_9BACT|nr:RNA polymerase sigma factor [Fulvivirga imtechensis]ELR73557.1 RNA polymerase ECF-type sigma factor [Fulvivirga imtechensis AK7]